MLLNMKEFKISFKDYSQAQKLHFGLKLYFFWGAILIIIFGLGLVPLISPIKKGSQFDANFSLVAFVVAVIFLLVVLSQDKRSKKIYDSNKTLKENIKITFNDKYVEWRFVSGYYRVAWKDIYKYKFNENTIIIYDAENLFRSIPTRAFENYKEKDSFLENFKNRTCSKS